MLQQKANHKPSEQVSARLSPQENDRIERLVAAGYCLNTSDFVRMAVREKLQGLAVAEAQRPPAKEAKRQILAYLDEHGQAYASDIALDLGLDISLVFAVLKNLQERGEVA
jgi:Arc/MetJ-type ribon-helix-helix transcriptional regulator